MHTSIGVLAHNNRRTGRIRYVDISMGFVTLQSASRTGEWDVDIPGISPVDSKDWPRITRLINDWINDAPDTED